MSTVYDSLFNWAKKTSTSIAELRLVSSTKKEAVPDADGLIYRLKQWPELSDERRTADVFRTLSVMSHRPVNRHWFVSHSKLQASEVDRLLADLIRQDAVEVTDAAKYLPKAA